MTNNEKRFVESIVNLEKNVADAQRYIKENYNIDSVFDPNELTVKLVSDNVNESKDNIEAALDYFNTTIDTNMVSATI